MIWVAWLIWQDFFLIPFWFVFTAHNNSDAKLCVSKEAKVNIRDDYNGDKTIIEIIQFNKAFKSIIILMIIIIDKAIFEVIGDLISGNFNSMKNKKG